MGYQIICCLHFNYIWLVLFIAYIFKNYARCESWKHLAFGGTCPIKGSNITRETMQTFPLQRALSFQLGWKKKGSTELYILRA